ncbi:MAG TPA: hypothetical protein VLB67_14760 [Acidimicrobiia bacterium]|nr:hypothetical protein [Acidimicrobiia bacterium]
MSRSALVWTAVVVLVGVVGVGIADVLAPDPVPVAGAIDLSGEAPPVRPTLDGFFVVPPRVVDFREDADDDSDDEPAVTPGVPSQDDSPDDSPDDLPDDTPDDTPDDDD